MLFIESNDEALSYFARLPREYQEVEYIQSTWTQYIDTWYIRQNNTGAVKFKYMSTAFWNSYHQYRLWWAYSNPNRAFILYVNTNPMYVWVSSQDDTQTSIALSVNTIYEMEQVIETPWTLKLKVNWSETTINYWSWTLTWSYTYYLFANHEWANWPWNTYWHDRLYYFKMYDWNELVHDFIPCYRKSDWVIWMYDIVNDVFYTNSWSWTFTKWWNV